MQLLRNAGYKGTGGLGAREQGVTAPLEAWKQSGKQGIGSSVSRSPNPHAHSPRSKASLNPKSSVPSILDETGNTAGNSNESASTRAKLKRRWPSVTVDEDMDSKQRRWKQILQV